MSGLGPGQQLPQIFGRSQVSIVTQFETEVCTEGPPDRVHVCCGLAN